MNVVVRHPPFGVRVSFISFHFPLVSFCFIFIFGSRPANLRKINAGGRTPSTRELRKKISVTGRPRPATRDKTNSEKCPATRDSTNIPKVLESILKWTIIEVSVNSWSVGVAPTKRGPWSAPRGRTALSVSGAACSRRRTRGAARRATRRGTPGSPARSASRRHPPPWLSPWLNFSSYFVMI